MMNFKQAAIQQTTLSELMGEREKIDTDGVISHFPEGITIVNFDLIDLSGKTYPILIFKEDDTKFLNGGMVLKKIVDAWLEGYDGDLTACNDDLRACGGVKIRLEKSRTKSGNNITTVKVL